MTPRTMLPWLAIGFVAIAAAALPGQVAWQLVNAANSPPTRAWHASATEVLGRVLVFGGYRVNGMSVWLDDTWLFDGLVWTQAQPATRPSMRSGHRLAHDLIRGRTVLFGGNGSVAASFLNDTWEWDGANWLLQTPAHQPGVRTHASMAFDLPRLRTVMFGGTGLGGLGNETWEWDGVDWTQVMTATVISPRQGAGLAADLARSRLVLFGGDGGALRNDTWEYDGQNWTLRQPATMPSPRRWHGFAYDSVRQRVVMFGGGNFSGDLADTWEWDGIDWRQRQPVGTAPSPRQGVTMTYDLFRGFSVLFGGALGASGSTMYADTFRYAATSPASFTVNGTGCGGTAGVPALLPVDGRAPWIGDAWGLQLALLPINAPAFLVLGFSRTAWGTTPLPMSLAGFGLPGCTLFSSPDATAFTVATGQVATWPIAIPNNQALVGMTLHAQGAGLDSTANVGGLVVSNGLELTLGGR